MKPRPLIWRFLRLRAGWMLFLAVMTAILFAEELVTEFLGDGYFIVRWVDEKTTEAGLFAVWAWLGYLIVFCVSACNRGEYSFLRKHLFNRKGEFFWHCYYLLVYAAIMLPGTALAFAAAPYTGAQAVALLLGYGALLALSELTAYVRQIVLKLLFVCCQIASLALTMIASVSLGVWLLIGIGGGAVALSAVGIYLFTAYADLDKKGIFELAEANE